MNKTDSLYKGFALAKAQGLIAIFDAQLDPSVGWIDAGRHRSARRRASRATCNGEILPDL